MRVKPKTPRTEMEHAAIINKMGAIYESLGTELGYGPEAVDVEMSRLATISARVVFDKDEIDFAIVQHSDSPDEIKTKFVKYIDTTCYQLIESAMRQIVAQDLPLTPPEQQPKAPEPSEKNS